MASVIDKLSLSPAASVSLDEPASPLLFQLLQTAKERRLHQGVIKCAMQSRPVTGPRTAMLCPKPWPVSSLPPATPSGSSMPSSSTRHGSAAAAVADAAPLHHPG